MTVDLSSSSFRTDAALDEPHGVSCSCPMHRLRARRLFTGLLASAAVPAWAQQSAAAADEGVRRDVGKESKFTKLVSAEEVEAAASKQYAQMLQQAQQQRALAPDSHPQVQRLRYIAQRLIPTTEGWNGRAKQWRWEVNLLGSKDLNAFCMPGGKIAFYFGILQQLQLSDNEVATIMGHEMAHALREHARERMGKTAATRLGAGALSALLGLGNVGDAALNMGAKTRAKPTSSAWIWRRAAASTPRPA
jgi:Zn-dependent protease with chaperone function